MTLCDELVQRLSELNFRADAERRVSYMPLGSIYWTDEFRDTLDDLFEDGNEARLAPLLRLFAIRGALWMGKELNDTDRAFWDAARAQVPDYALFHRLEVSEEEVAMYRDVAKAARGFWCTFFQVDNAKSASAATGGEDAQDVELLTEVQEDAEVLSEADIVSTPTPAE